MLREVVAGVLFIVCVFLTFWGMTFVGLLMQP